MSEIVLVTEPLEIPWENDFTLSSQGVVGVTPPGAPTLLEYTYKLTGKELETPLELEDGAAERLADFYRRCCTAEPEARPYYNCHMLAWYVSGNVPDLGQNEPTIQAATPATYDSLERGKTYAIQSGRWLAHSMLGVADPTKNLSVLGAYEPMVITDNIDIMTAYQGTRILQTDLGVKNEYAQ